MQQNTKVALATLGATFLGGGLWYLWSKNSEKAKEIQSEKPQEIQQVGEIDDDTLISFLRDLRSQSYPHFFLVASITSKMKIEFNDEDTFQKVLQSKVLPEIQKLFESKQNLVCTKYNSKIEPIQNAVDKSKNKTVLALKASYEKLYLDATNGVEPKIDLDERTIESMKEKIVISMLNEILIKSITIIHEVCTILRERNGNSYQFSLQSQDFQKLLFEKRFVEEKQAVLIRHQVTQFEPQVDELGLPTSETEVYQKILHLMKKENQSFDKIITELENKYDTLINRFFKEPISQSEGQFLIEQLGGEIQNMINAFE